METIKSIITNSTFLTVISGVLVFILGQLFIECVLNPIKEYKKLKAEISYELVYYARNFANPILFSKEDIEKWDIAGDKIRDLASKVEAFAQIKPIYIFPKKKTLLLVRDKLIGISNGCIASSSEIANEYMKLNVKASKDIESLLFMENIRNGLKYRVKKLKEKIKK